MVLAVDPFSKWVEIGTVPTLNSHEVAEWFHREVVCRYGVPARVRTDQGCEYRGQFSTYLRANGIVHSLIATNNPRANGQVERYVRTMKAGIRTFLGACGRSLRAAPGFHHTLWCLSRLLCCPWSRPCGFQKRRTWLR